MKAGIYAHISIEGQDLEVQLAVLRAHIAARGWHLAGEYIDRGHSGARERRPALDRLMRAVSEDELHAVLVWRFDCFARSMKHFVTVLETFYVLRVEFISLEDQFDTETPIGQAMLPFIRAIARLERDVVRLRIRAGLDEARARGVRPGRPVVPVTTDQVAALRRKGLSLGSIARHLHCSRATVQRRLHGLGTPDSPAAGTIPAAPSMAL